MNNITFGDEGCGYYETVAGGAGAVSGAISQIFTSNSWYPNAQILPRTPCRYTTTLSQSFSHLVFSFGYITWTFWFDKQ